MRAERNKQSAPEPCSGCAFVGTTTGLRFEKPLIPVNVSDTKI